MPINIGINPIAAADAVFDISGNQQAQKDAQAASERWNMYDRRVDADRYLDARSDYWRGLKRDDTRISRMLRDAKSAGIGPLAALGAPGASPTQISMPGRVGGTYRSTPIFKDLNQIAQLNMTMDVGLKKAQIDKTNAETNLVRSQTPVKDNQIMTTKPVISPEQQVEVQGSLDQNVKSLTSRYRTPDGKMVRGPSQEFPDFDQVLLWWLADIKSKIDARMDHPYHSELSRGRRGRLTRRGRRRRK